MRSILKLNKGGFFSKNKRGLSAVIAYILLISMAIALSTMVYNWLRFYVEVEETEQCPEGVFIAISDYDCDSYNKIFSVTLKNRGRWTADGFSIRVHDRVGATQGIYNLNTTGIQLTPLAPGTSETFEYEFPTPSVRRLTDVTFVEIQPFIISGNTNNANKSFCQPIVTQTISCQTSGCTFGEEYFKSSICLSGELSYWPFDTDLTDSFGSNNGTAEGGVSVSDGVLVLDGEDAYVNYNNLGIVAGDDFTIAAWIKMDSIDSDGYVFTKGNSGNGPLLIWRDEVANNTNINALSAFVTDGTNTIEISSSNNTLNDVEWYHIAVTLESGIAAGFNLYIDGALEETSSTVDFTGIIDNANPFYIGAYHDGPGGFFDGSIDDVLIIDRALTAEQISSIYAAKRG